MMMLKGIAVLALMARFASAQSAGFHAPVTGLVYSPTSHSVQPLIGVPGAAYLGSPVLSGADSVSIAPAGGWAFAVVAGRGAFLHGLADAAAAEASTDGLIQAVDRVVWNRGGSFVLLYSSSANQLQRVRLTDAGVSADAPLDLSPWGQAAALAIDPSGRQIAFGVAGSGLYLSSDGQSPALLSPAPRPVAAAFDETGLRLYAVDLDQQQILAFDSGSGPVLFASLAQADGTLSNPVGLAVSGGGRYLLVADNAVRAVRVYETASQTLANTIPLDFAPSRMDALSTAPIFLLNGDNSKEWLMLLDARQVPAVYFVPASQQEPL